MAWQRGNSAALILLLGGLRVADAAEPQRSPMSGLYEVDVRLELPHIEEWAVKKRAILCISDDEGDGRRGLVVLSDNNPLATCPASNVRRNRDVLTFDIICEGRNAATASATFKLAVQQFRGRIAMVMGGKNMTMTEIQVGHRIGDCPPGP
jgi:hypothetical protein